MTMNVKSSFLTSVLALSCGAYAHAADLASTNWQSSAAAGVTITRGNSSTLLATLGAVTGKKWDDNEISLGIDGAYGTSKISGVSQTTAAQIHGFAQYNRLFTEKFYGYLRVEGLNDS